MNREPTAWKWLRAKRAAAHLTQAQLAGETGLTVRDIQRMEHGDMHVSCRKYWTVAQYFNVMLEDMLYGEVLSA